MAALIHCFDDGPVTVPIAAAGPVDLAPVDLDPAPAAPEPVRARTPTHRTITSDVLFTTLAGDTALVVIKVTIDGWERHQLYAADTTVWALVGIFTLYVEALQELLRWRRYLTDGGSITAWLTTHPDGIQPDRSSFDAQSTHDRHPDALPPRQSQT
jgi:hypothetical protein